MLNRIERSRLNRAIDALQTLNKATYRASDQIDEIVRLQKIDIDRWDIALDVTDDGWRDPEQSARNITQAIARIHQAIEAACCSVDYANERIADFVSQQREIVQQSETSS